MTHTLYMHIIRYFHLYLTVHKQRADARMVCNQHTMVKVMMKMMHTDNTAFGVSSRISRCHLFESLCSMKKVMNEKKG